MELLELTKKKAELEFRKELLQSSGTLGKPVEELHNELEKVASRADVIGARINSAGVRVIQLKKDKLDDFNARLRSVPKKEIIDAMKSRSGDIYALLCERGKIVKANFENRSNIAKISLLAARLDDANRQKLIQAVNSGAIAEAIGLGSLNDKDRQRLERLLRRIGINAGIAEGLLSGDVEAANAEVALDLPDRKIWVSQEVSQKLNANFQRMDDLNRKIQLKNAQRQISTFSEEEEKEFSEFQGEYLKLLKEQDELLQEFKEEERISFISL